MEEVVVEEGDGLLSSCDSINAIGRDSASRGYRISNSCCVACGSL
jgi:hypothetical protein